MPDEPLAPDEPDVPEVLEEPDEPELPDDVVGCTPLVAVSYVPN